MVPTFVLPLSTWLTDHCSEGFGAFWTAAVKSNVLPPVVTRVPGAEIVTLGTGGGGGFGSEAGGPAHAARNAAHGKRMYADARRARRARRAKSRAQGDSTCKSPGPKSRETS